MAKIHLVCGIPGAGKTTVARRLAVQTNAVRLTHDAVMRRFFGADPDASTFAQHWRQVDAFLWQTAEDIVSAGAGVILDYGFWTKAERADAFERASRFCSDITFHCVECDVDTARKRVLSREPSDKESLIITAETFDRLVRKFEPFGTDEHYDIIYYRNV